jgi:hypothetical protein
MLHRMEGGGILVFSPSQQDFLMSLPITLVFLRAD